MLKVYTSNQEAFEKYCNVLRSAKESIIIFTWIIIKDNLVFDIICEILKERMKNGVNVYLVYSDAKLSAYISEL
jgi:phosphatidylserine/phosphatidylglycerophosphate/cardiolipin synthase-like enzyme